MVLSTATPPTPTRGTEGSGSKNALDTKTPLIGGGRRRCHAVRCVGASPRQRLFALTRGCARSHTSSGAAQPYQTPAARLALQLAAFRSLSRRAPMPARFAEPGTVTIGQWMGSVWFRFFARGFWRLRACLAVARPRGVLAHAVVQLVKAVVCGASVAMARSRSGCIVWVCARRMTLTHCGRRAAACGARRRNCTAFCDAAAVGRLRCVAALCRARGATPGVAAWPHA